LFDVWSHLWYKRFNAEQDHSFGGGDCRAVCGSVGFRHAIMHSLQRASSTSVQAGFVREQDLLRDFKRAQIDSSTSAGESRFRLRRKRGIRRVGYCDSSAESGSCQAEIPAFQRIGCRAFISGTRSSLLVSDLIHRL